MPGFTLTVSLAVAAPVAPTLAAGGPAVSGRGPLTGGTQLWAATGSREAAESVAVSPDGSRVFVTGDSGATVAYAAPAGGQLWQASFAGSLRVVAVSPDGSRVFVTGKTTGPSGLLDYATVAYDAATGSQLWAATYASAAGADVATAVRVSPDSTTVYVTGSSAASSTVSDYTTVAYAAATGKQRWAARYAGPGRGFSAATALGVSGDGTRVLVTGTTCASRCSSDPVYDYATVAYAAATGHQQWAARYLAGSGAPSDALAVSPDGTRVFVTGPAPSSSGPSTDYATVGYAAATGKQLWVTRFDDGNADVATGAGVSPDGTRVFVTGYSHSAAGTGYATVGYNAATGSQLWVTRDTSATISASSLAVTPDGTTVIMTGTSAAGSAATVGYDAATGSQLWQALYAGPCNRGAQPNALAISPGGARVFVTGTTPTGNCSYRPASAYATVAYRTR